jgi:hypothetical protein
MAGVASGQGTHTRTVERRVELPAGGVVCVDHQYGNVVIAGAATDSVAVKALVSVSGADSAALHRFTQGADVLVRLHRETLSVRTVYPRLDAVDSSLGYGADLELSVPSWAGLVVENRFGDVVVAGVFGPERLGARYGNIDLEGCGPLGVTSWYGDVVVVGTEGPSAIESEFGLVVLDDPTGTVSVDSRYGSIRARLSDPGLQLLDIVSHAGDVELEIGDGLPYRLTAASNGGMVRSDVPLRFVDIAGTKYLNNRVGQGGPALDVLGNSSNILIRAGAARQSGR